MAKLKTLAERTRDNDWPTPATFKSPEECEAAYNNGYEGCFPDPDGAEMMESQEDGIFADAASVNPKAVNNQHGLTTCNRRTTPTMKLPELPKGVKFIEANMCNPQSDSNPFQHVSRAYVTTATGKSDRTRKVAALYVKDTAIALMDQAFVKASEI